jgi:DNA polymerase III sliding clamp (beta) subunit (PCNA family)
MKLEITGAQAATIGKAIKPAISTEKIHLSGVLLDSERINDADHVTFTATDGYRCHKVTLQASNFTPGENLVLSGLDLVKALATCAKAASKNGKVTVTVENGLVTVSSVGISVGVPTLSVEFPNMGPILSPEPENDGPAAFDGDFFSDAMAAAALIAGKGNNVKILNLNPRKCCHIRANSNDSLMGFHAVLMPQRTVGDK